MLRTLTLLLFFGFLFSCSKEKEVFCGPCGENMNRVETPETPEEAIKITTVQDTAMTGNAEFQENKAKIEAKYGEQWDFCHCVVLNDSLDKAVKAGNIDDKLMSRLEEVDTHCKAFLVMDASQTPEQRAIHDKKIKKCLRAAGITR
jgi:hypothetical protein